MINLGCDTKFGYETAKRLNSYGFTVFAFCSSRSDFKKSNNYSDFSDDIIAFGLDVTDINRVQEVKDQIIQRLQVKKLVLWAVVNVAENIGLSNDYY